MPGKSSFLIITLLLIVAALILPGAYMVFSQTAIPKRNKDQVYVAGDRVTREENGFLRAVSAGEAIVTVRMGGKSEECRIVVIEEEN